MELKYMLTGFKNMSNKSEELVMVDGLQFKPYQMEVIEVLTKAQKYGDIKKFIEGSVILNIRAQLEGLEANYAEPILEKLKEDGF
jgi:hypothetical protein